MLLGSPTDFTVKISNPHFTLMDYYDIIEDFQQRNFYGCKLEVTTIESIFILTNGHCGYVASILSVLNSYGGELTDQVAQHSILYSFDCMSYLKAQRCSPKRRFLDDEDIENIRKICTFGYIQADPKSIILVKAGVANIDDDIIQFNSRLAYNIAFEWLYKSKRQIDVQFKTLDDLVMNIFSLIPLNIILHSLSLGNDGELSEKFWQCEFYRLITAILPHETYLGCDAQYINSICNLDSTIELTDEQTELEGKVDFYLNSNYCWAIELLINGYQMKNSLSQIEIHEKRFHPLGQYYRLVQYNICKSHLVIDISSSLIHRYGDLTRRRPKFSNCWIVIYTLYEVDSIEKIKNENGETVDIVKHFSVVERPKFDVYKFDENGFPHHTEIPIRNNTLFD